MTKEVKKRSDLKLIRLILPYMSSEKALYIKALLLLPLSVLVPILLPRLVKRIVDNELPNGMTSGLLTWVGIFIAVVLAQFAVTTMFQVIVRTIGLKIVVNLRGDLFRRLLSFPISFFRSEPKGRLVSRLTTDLDQIDDMFASGGLLLISDVLSIAAIGVAMILLSPTLGLWGLSIVPFMALVILWISIKMREIVRAVRAQTAKMNAFSQEALSAHDVVAVLGAREKFGDDFDRLSGEFERMTIRANRYEAAFYAGIDFFGSIAVGMVLWAATGSLESAGLLIAMTQYVQQFFVPLRGLATRFSTFQQAMVALERVEHFMNFPTEPVTGRSAIYPPAIPLEIKNLNFSYRENLPVLSDVNLKLKAGMHLALLGETGSGKSTLARILLGFYRQQSGSIAIAADDLDALNLPTRRHTITLVPQEVFLFDASIEDNIAMGREIAEDRLAAIVESVNLTTMRGVESGAGLGEWGRRLSEGEKQLIAAARVIAYGPSIVVLDEATSALDPLLDAQVRAAIRKALEGRSAIIIAHRLSTLQSADLIAVMHKGRIVEVGTHQELKALGGIYSKLYRLLELVEAEKVSSDIITR